ncbi:MAG: right-handed parallel beta-helix repeat-containing protein [Acidobacteriota bacterium]
MLTQLFRSAGFAALIILSTQAQVHAQPQVHDVDCAAGPNFDIQQGVNAAADGEVVVVHPCVGGNYTAFSVIGRNNLQIVGADLGGGFISAFQIGANASPPNASVPLLDDPTSTCARISNSTNISIVGLHIETCGGRGFDIVNSDHISLHGNRTSFTNSEAVAVRNSTSVDIVGNRFRGAQLYAIATDPNSRFVKIEANRISNNLAGILMQGSAIDVTNNEVRTNGTTGIAVLSTQSKVSRNWATGNAGPQINFQNWSPGFENCVVGNWLGGLGLFPAMSASGCQAENF